ncbi:MAG TPA: hypothetical protein DIU35_02715 [Candidatus Latescibacteria bacterium]|nr:hypothetical protein [Gemmatimonadota bacterium]MBB31331.1 hypothetical protein [Gemmatimonadota bacterium]HCR16370.1 hypothetical protein [Candidatus Latescibacterota bacterium]
MGFVFSALAKQTHRGGGFGEPSPETATFHRASEFDIPILNANERKLVDTSEVTLGHWGSFTSAFSPRVLGIHFSTVDSNLGGYKF